MKAGEIRTRNERRARRERFIWTCFNVLGIYVAVFAGVLFTEIVIDIQTAETLAPQFIFAFSWIQIGAGAVIASWIMSRFERKGDIIGRQKNLKRRITHAFSQGAAIRGLVEILWVLIQILGDKT